MRHDRGCRRRTSRWRDEISHGRRRARLFDAKHARKENIVSRSPFLDLGFSKEEATTLHIRSQLAATLEQYIERKGWSQAEAARSLKVPQPTVSKIVNGNIDRLSIEFLVKLMVRVGLPVSVSSGRGRRATHMSHRSAA
jgi:predicted XRE-type DNA-binding protein